METEWLRQADQLDSYQTACQRDGLNRRARINCQYIPWHDQAEAYKWQKNMGSDYRIVIMNPSADGGLPHTRAPNLICIPAYYPHEKYAHTLQHELVHIHQRQNPDLWKEQCVREGWAPMSEWDAVRQIPKEHLQRCRLNPDTLSCRFQAWEARYVPLPLFVREDKPSLRETVVRWYDLEDERLRFDPPLSYVKRYGNVDKSSQEHPFELWAYNQESK